LSTHTLGETRTKETGNLLDQGVGGYEGIVLAGELLNQLLVLVELLQIVRRHGVNAAVLGTINIMLVAKNATQISAPCLQILSIDLPDRHVGSGDNRKADRSRETLITLGIIVLEADLELDGLEEVPLLRLQRVLEEFLDIDTHSGYNERSVSLSLD
jgi:hypothetical protein